MLEFDTNTFVPETPMENPEMSVLPESEEISDKTLTITPPPVWMTPAPRPRPHHLFSNVSPLEDSHAHVTFVQETPEVLDFSRDMFESSSSGSPEQVSDTPVEVPIPTQMLRSKTAYFV